MLSYIVFLLLCIIFMIVGISTGLSLLISPCVFKIDRTKNCCTLEKKVYLAKTI